MKKYRYLPILLVAIFLLLCACTQENNEQPAVEFNPPSRTPSLRPSSSPALLVPEYTAPTTAPRLPVIKPTQPATTPTQPTRPTWTPPPTKPNLDWVTNREIVPFEDRFKEDVPFGGYYRSSWFAPCVHYGDADEYHFIKPYLDKQSGYYNGGEIVWEHGMETEFMYTVPVEPKLLADHKLLTADGRWAFLYDDDEMCRLELLTGELTTLATRNEGDIRWDIQACGKDTVCIFQLDAERNLRIYYRDLHSEAEKTLYEGVLPDVPTDKDSLHFYAPTTTHGQAYWEMLNPAFYEVYQKELSDPNSSLKDAEHFDIAVQDHYKTPMLVRYFCDFDTGVLTADYGVRDNCHYGEDLGHNHFDYENTKEEIPEVLDTAPVKIPNISKPEGDDIWYRVDTALTLIYSDFGYGQPYVALDSPIWKMADFYVIESEISSHFAFFITTEGTIVQFNYNNKHCNTIYSSENELSELFWCNNYLYFVEGDTIVCIDLVAGTYQPIIRSSLKELSIVGNEYIYYPDDLYFRVCQGLYCKEYRFNPETGELIEERFEP